MCASKVVKHSTIKPRKVSFELSFCLQPGKERFFPRIQVHFRHLCRPFGCSWLSIECGEITILPVSVLTNDTTLSIFNCRFKGFDILYLKIYSRQTNIAPRRNFFCTTAGNRLIHRVDVFARCWLQSNANSLQSSVELASANLMINLD
ncbi:unnamed protein product [Albugo candida]|uniref:Uncharacterized protein n=1 Tax=Albugo candida TaxID=65357 RepID=A0A024FV93_9STRA|nr:unnamed protein product [Albugo candida]|eukprot:CCI11025.1 unnamed protein product [Albugo candida]